jgi:peptidoglycan/xylan/chitin deacetylase (PgdA/CDA1 family)
MSASAHHVKLWIGAALASAVVLASGCSLVGAATGSVATATGRGPQFTPSTLTATLSSRALPRDDCQLRVPSPLPSRERRVPILMYHRIDYVTSSTPAATKALTVSPEAFRHEMKWLKRHRYHAITQRKLFDALMCGRRLPRKRIVITFDDGYRDVHKYALPVLERFRMHAIAYVITGRISGSDPSFLTWKQLRDFERRGVEIGSHTVSHTALASVSDSTAIAELVKSRKKLERKLGHRVPWLAYPYGSYDTHVEHLAKKAGYLLAVTTDWGARQSALHPLALQRLRILDSTGVGGLAAILAAST